MNSLISDQTNTNQPPSPTTTTTTTSRYENQKRRDWNTFNQYLSSQNKPPVPLSQCNGTHVLSFLRYLDQFGKTKVHSGGCRFYGHPSPPEPCPCPLRQAWGSLDSLVGRLRAAFEEHGGSPASNPFAARAVRVYLREVRDAQSKARGVSYDKKKRKLRSKRVDDSSDSPSPSSSSTALPPPPSVTWGAAGHFFL